MCRTGRDASAAPDAKRNMKSTDTVTEFVHDPLAGTLFLGRPRIMPRDMPSEQVELAGIPDPHAGAIQAPRFLLDIKAMAGRTQKRAGAAPDARLMNPVPELGIENRFKIALNGRHIQGRRDTRGRQLARFRDRHPLFRPGRRKALVCRFQRRALVGQDFQRHPACRALRAAVR